MDRIVKIKFNDNSRVIIPLESFSLNSVALFIIKNEIYKPGSITSIDVQTVYIDTVYMEEK